MMLPFLVCQKWTELAVAGGWFDRATLVATTAQGGDFGFSRGAEAAQGGALAGMLKAIFVEFVIMQNSKNLRVKVVDAPLDACPAELGRATCLRELASGNLAYEVAYVARPPAGRRMRSSADLADTLRRPAARRRHAAGQRHPPRLDVGGHRRSARHHGRRGLGIGQADLD